MQSQLYSNVSAALLARTPSIGLVMQLVHVAVVFGTGL